MMKKLSHKAKKTSTIFVVLATSASVAFASCGGTESLVAKSAADVTASVINKIANSTKKILDQDKVDTDSLLSALRVLTQQVAASSDKEVAGLVQSESAKAKTAATIADQELANALVVDFTSQGFNPCEQSEATKKMAVAEMTARNAVPNRVRQEIDGGGGRYASVSDVLTQREEQHQKLFCTQDEVDIGACKSLGKIPGGNTNAALLFSTDKTADMVAAKNAVINNIIGLPDSPLPIQAVNSPEAQAYILEKKRKDAFLAFPAHSLKTIQTENEQFKETMDTRVGQFFGTPKAGEWAKSQASQSTRGILVDLVKIQGLNLKIHERRIRENLRIESNLAALLELDNQRINGPETAAAAAQIATAGAAGRVK